MKKNKVYLTLQNGRIFQGYRFGANGDATGEIVFTTGMVGYLKTLTDPANYGKIVVQTFPLIGNVGVIEEEFESDKTWVSAYIVREYCDAPSNFRCEGTLAAFMEKAGVIGVYGIDTRELARIIREEGEMNARISSAPLTAEELASLKENGAKNAVAEVTPRVVTEYGEKTAEYKVALWNFGAKKSEIEALAARGYRVISVPATYTAADILALSPNGVVLSDGPSDPKANGSIVEELKKLLGKTPLFGVGFGGQLLALAAGGDTVKMKYGHRGGNQPVKYYATGRTYISTQNHGYVVNTDSVQNGKVTFVNANDGTCEGADYDELNAFFVQFSPETVGGASGENFLYEKFTANMQKEKK